MASPHPPYDREHLEGATRLSDFIRYGLWSLAIIRPLSFPLWFFVSLADSSAKGSGSWAGCTVPIDSAQTDVDVHYDMSCTWASYYYVV